MSKKEIVVVDPTTMKFSDLKTKKAKVEFMKIKLHDDDRWILKGLLTIYKYQTEEEKAQAMTKEHNGVGFSGNDAEFLTSLAVRLIARGVPSLLAQSVAIKVSSFLSPKQEAILRNKMPRYANQLLTVAVPAKPVKTDVALQNVEVSTNEYLKASKGE